MIADLQPSLETPHTVEQTNRPADPEPSAEARKMPQSIADAGLRKAFLADLTLKTMYISASPNLRELAYSLRLPYRVVDEVFRQLRVEQLLEVTGMTGNTPCLGLTARGRERAVQLLEVCQYTGPAPVSLDDYVQQVRRQSTREVEIHSADMHRAFSHLVLDDKFLDQLGTAMNSGAPIFLYGPSGTGKTVIATALPRVLACDHVWIPFAVQVENQVITLFDPHVHDAVSSMEMEETDPRWVLCRRPTVLVGGELTADMLELQLNPMTKFYHAPVQMKANNGVLVIDDFGRQRVRPEELLNRWVVPLDRGVDILTLAGGKKVQVPFEMLVVFATNLSPAELADAAFLRRMQTKILVGTVSHEQFHEIFNRVCRDAGLEFEPAVIDDVIDIIENQQHEPLRACHPRDIVNQIRWAARYAERAPSVDRASVLVAVEAYFLPLSR
jgi:MoxR-like ATPase